MNIVDIDFRYVMRTVPAPELGEGVCRMMPVLQWRKKIQYAAARDMSMWTKWQDVRTEEE